MKVVAFDPGYDEVGAACVEGDCSDGYSLKDHEQINITKYVNLQKDNIKGMTIFDSDTEAYRLGIIRETVIAFLKRNSIPDLIVIEMPGYFTRRNKKGVQVNSPQVQKLQKGFSAVVVACVEYATGEGIPLTKIHKYIHLHDMSIKRNRGVAKKKVAQQRAWELWKKELKPDEADASMLALLYVRMQ